MKHLINRLQFEFNCADEAEAFNFRENFSITFQEQIASITDTICSKYAGEGEWRRVDKIEIDLGYVSPHSLDTNFAAVFEDKFEKQLALKIQPTSLTENETFLVLSKTELFKYFLQTGTLPWWAGETKINIDEIAFDLITHQTEMIKDFFYHNRYKQNLWIRVAFQLGKETKAIIVSLIDELRVSKDLFINLLGQLNVLLKKEVANELHVSDETMEDSILKNAPEIFQSLRNENIFLETFKKIVDDNSAVDKSIIEKIIRGNKPGFIALYNEIFNKDLNEGVSSEMNGHREARHNHSLLNDEIIRGDSSEEKLPEKYIVKHAGIILVAPFIKPYFNNMHLLHNDEWKNRDAQYKAVHLLKFISTGEQKMPEYDLPLEKLICGLGMEEAIPLDIVLQEYEMNEAVTLLESVIAHWTALRNTSVNGLRDSFLKRDGLLTKKENGWLLQVERKTLDVLIDSIPWGYSTLAFPWSSHLIFVEW